MKRILVVLVLAGLGMACSAKRGEVFRRVRPPVAFELLRDNRETFILDLRPFERYAGPSGHLAGALCFPVTELDARQAELRHLREQTFLIYCDSDECAQAGLEWFLANGFRNAMVMDGGIDSWIERGFGTIVSPAPQRDEAETKAEEPPS